MRELFQKGAWRGTALIAAVYVYFLIFAQFGFLARLAQLGIGGVELKTVLAAMAVGGVLLSLSSERLLRSAAPAWRLRVGFAVAACAALTSTAALSLPAAIACAFLIGAGLGIATVTLVAHLPLWMGSKYAMGGIGLGAGIGYFVCNIPAIFTATPTHQALLAAGLLLAAAAVPASNESAPTDAPQMQARIGFLPALIAFAALIWLDSAAYYIIQHNPQLKAGTWTGNAHLWLNASLHLGAALAAALLLWRGHARAVLAVAVATLGFACLLLAYPSLILSASLFYPVGVSFYSVALVAYPAYLSGAASAAERGRRAGAIYAVAGWIGSALGIGMGQNLGHVSPAFVLAAALAVLAPALYILLRNYPREAALLAAAVTCSAMLWRVLPADAVAPAHTAVERGRQVYISEGCIVCHSQFVRPNTADELLWGPASTVAEVHAQRPPLIGNRRQGPDLARVGARRSPLWLKTHLIAPRELSYASPMPSYNFLFLDGRGDDLVAYLASLKPASTTELAAAQLKWQPAPAAWNEATPAEGAQLYAKYCVTCHSADGATRLRWRQSFSRLPVVVHGDPLSTSPASTAQLARVIKFGISTTDMPGHEYLSDRKIAALALWWAAHPAQPLPSAPQPPTGDTP